MEKHNPHIDSTNHNTEHITIIDAKATVISQEVYDEKKDHLVGRKMTKSTYEKIFLKNAKENSVVLDIERDPETDIINLKSKNGDFDSFGKVPNAIDDDPYTVGGECNTSS